MERQTTESAIRSSWAGRVQDSYSMSRRARKPDDAAAGVRSGEEQD